MRKIIYYTGFCAVVIILFIGVSWHYDEKRDDEILQNQNEILQNQTELRVELKHRNYLDSLYYEHLSKCSMIDEENIGIDRRGYLYSKYHKKYGW